MNYDQHGSSEFQSLLARAQHGDREALSALFAVYRSRLRRMVQVRLDYRLRSRVDASDVLQDTFIDVSLAADRYFREQRIPFFLWLRLMTGRRLMNIHRHHLGARKRDVTREVSIYETSIPNVSSVSMADHLTGKATSVSHAVFRAEIQTRIQQALNSMSAVDREILSLRHLEELSNQEIAQELNISQTAASNRYVRALERLSVVLSDLQQDTR